MGFEVEAGRVFLVCEEVQCLDKVLTKQYCLQLLGIAGLLASSHQGSAVTFCCSSNKFHRGVLVRVESEL